MDIKSLEEQALSLPPANRAKLAHELLESLDALSSEELQALWVEEAERRAREVDSGAVRLVPGPEVSRKARALLR
jgi:restriction endonuclease Mrr